MYLFNNIKIFLKTHTHTHIYNEKNIIKNKPLIIDIIKKKKQEKLFFFFYSFYNVVLIYSFNNFYIKSIKKNGIQCIGKLPYDSETLF